MTAANDIGAAAMRRERFIPVRKDDLLAALAGNEALASETERQKFLEICRSLAAIHHYDYFDALERLRHDYFYFSPELDPHARFDHSALEAAYADLVQSFESVIKHANFVEMSHEEVEAAHRQRKVMRVKVAASIEDFRDIRFFYRGHHRETVEMPQWLGLRKETHEVLVYDDIILFAATKPGAQISARERKLLARRRIRPGSVLIKYFRNVASTDLNALFPNVRVVMGLFDSLALGVPAIAGAIPILLNIASTITVLFLVIGFYLGVVAEVEHDALKRGFAAMSGLAALIGFIMRQWLRYQRASLKYQRELTDNIYFRNVNNNAGIFDTIIGSAEDQECKEAFLAYYFLRTAPTTLTQAELERRIEQWLAEAFGVEIDFAMADALAKLDRFCLLKHDGGHLQVAPPDEALVHLTRAWAKHLPARAAAAAAPSLLSSG